MLKRCLDAARSKVLVVWIALIDFPTRSLIDRGYSNLNGQLDLSLADVESVIEDEHEKAPRRGRRKHSTWIVKED